jgi:hypothetical protein
VFLIAGNARLVAVDCTLELPQTTWLERISSGHPAA